MTSHEKWRRAYFSLQGGSAESVTEPSDPQSAAVAALGYPGIWKHPGFALISHEAGAGSCGDAELPSFQGVRSFARLWRGTGRQPAMPIFPSLALLITPVFVPVSPLCR